LAYDVSDLSNDTLILLGNLGEVGAASVEFDLTDWQTDYPTGATSIAANPGVGDGLWISFTRGGESVVYPELAASLSLASGILTWTPQAAVTDVAGYGTVILHCNESGDEKRSILARTYVADGHGDAVGVVPVWVANPLLTDEIKTDTTAATDLTITTGAAKTLVLDTTVYDDIIISASNLRGGVTAPAFAEFIAPVWALKFINGQTDTVYGSFEIPHTYKEGTALEVHVHWSPSSTNTEDCVWKFNAVVENMGSAGAFGAIPEMTATDAGGGVAFTHQYASFGTIAGTGRRIGDIIAFELTRPAGDGFTGDAFLHSIGVHFQVDTMGSRQISSKT
jgi:hypothetical protein